MEHSAPRPGTEYSESGFREKLQQYARVAGSQVIERALQLYYASQSPDTPAWARTVAYGALAYFVLPTDAIADFLPAVGYADDLGVIAMALATIAMRITPDVKAQARERMRFWFE